MTNHKLEKMDFERNKRISLFIIISTIFVIVGLQGSVTGYTGGEIVIMLNSAHFAPLAGTDNYQVKVLVNYTVSDPILVGQKINAVMKIHSANGSLLKTTSFPVGFTANNTGMTQLLTNIPISTSQNITTETVFTDLNKTSLVSNPVKTLPLISNPINSSEFIPAVISNKTNT
jgi:hypothetical protein